MSWQIIHDVLDGSRNKGSALLLLVVIAEFATKDGVAWPAVSTLATRIRMSARNTRYLIKALENSGELVVERNAGPRGCNRYRVQILQGGKDCREATDGREGVQPVAAGGATVIASEPSLTVIAPCKSTAAAKLPTPAGQPRQTTPTWIAYSEAYQKRYNVPPVRNSSVNGQIANFVKRIGPESAPAVAAFYVSDNRSDYMKAHHQFSLLLRDAEGMHTAWATSNRSKSLVSQRLAPMCSSLPQTTKNITAKRAGSASDATPSASWLLPTPIDHQHALDRYTAQSGDMAALLNVEALALSH